MNESIFKGKWSEFKGEIQNKWGRLAGDDLESVKGNLDAIAGLVEQSYGHAKDQVMRQLNEMGKRFSSEAVDQTQAAKQTLRDGKVAGPESRH